MSKHPREFLSTLILLFFVWLSAFTGDFIATRTLQLSGMSIHNPWWSVTGIGLLQLMLMYAGARIILNILAPGRFNKKVGLIATLLAWLSLEKILTFPRWLSTALPNGVVSANTTVSTIIVIAAHLAATYVLVLIISRMLLAGEDDKK